MNRLKIIILFFLTCSRIVPALSQTGIGQWRSHLPYSKAIKVTEGDNKIYCAISEGLFYYDKTSNSISKLTKVEGLSDVGISSINYSAENNVLVVAYSNSNIDLITGNRIYNIPDIKNKTIMGNRTINQISFRGTDACLSCGFGIVVLNLARMEIKDTYIIGAGGS
ncbi:MAG: Por secretion system protein, partial [Bacteroidota bacterium]|nr:Por secretion system protein [Bacteroidota bacterium]